MMMALTQTVALVACLISFFTFAHGAKDGLLRKKLYTNANVIRIQNIVSVSDVQSAFRELLDHSNRRMEWDSSMSLSMSMSYNSVHPSSTVVPPAIATTDTPVAPVVVMVEPPMTVVNPVVTQNKATGEKQEKVSRGGLTGGTIVGVSVAAMAVLAVAALLVKIHPTQQSSAV